ncbi:MAG: hypothetical protein AB7G47_19325 [Mycolicibacterium sp.]|uniref:hypothetical protein n=1 Tax=Mycolicibacterium sp. TaxID=2320850 RepID=UPI003D13633D
MSDDGYREARAAAKLPRAGIAARWFDSGWCAAADREVLHYPGGDDARVRYALHRFGPDMANRTGRRAFAKGVRAKLAYYRRAGHLDPLQTNT